MIKSDSQIMTDLYFITDMVGYNFTCDKMSVLG